jgi:hypothetical protein
MFGFGGLFSLIASLLLVASPARANIPKTFTVQGVLRDMQGALQTMPVNVNVTLYDAQMDPSNVLFAPPMFTNLPVSNGLFSVVLTIPDATLSPIANAAEVWVGVTVGSDEFPRQKVTPVVSALLCGNADTVTNGVYTNGSYSDPTWITSLADSKITGNTKYQHVLTTTSCGNGKELRGLNPDGTPICVGRAGNFVFWSAGSSSYAAGFGADWISSVSRNGTGNLTIGLVSGFFGGGSPICTANLVVGSATGGQVTMGYIDANQVNIFLFNAAGTAIDGSFEIICVQY